MIQTSLFSMFTYCILNFFSDWLLRSIPVVLYIAFVWFVSWLKEEDHVNFFKMFKSKLHDSFYFTTNFTRFLGVSSCNKYKRVQDRIIFTLASSKWTPLLTCTCLVLIFDAVYIFLKQKPLWRPNRALSERCWMEYIPI